MHSCIRTIALFRRNFHYQELLLRKRTNNILYTQILIEIFELKFTQS